MTDEFHLDFERPTPKGAEANFDNVISFFKALPKTEPDVFLLTEEYRIFEGRATGKR